MAQEKKAISRRPGKEKPHDEAPAADEGAIASFIGKGGSVPKKTGGYSNVMTEVRINFRVPSDMLAEIDAMRKTRRIKTSRNTWLLEAMQDKLDRDAC